MRRVKTPINKTSKIEIISFEIHSFLKIPLIFSSKFSLKKIFIIKTKNTKVGANPLVSYIIEKNPDLSTKKNMEGKNHKE